MRKSNNERNKNGRKEKNENINITIPNVWLVDRVW